MPSSSEALLVLISIAVTIVLALVGLLFKQSRDQGRDTTQRLDRNAEQTNTLAVSIGRVEESMLNIVGRVDKHDRWIESETSRQLDELRARVRRDQQRDGE